MSIFKRIKKNKTQEFANQLQDIFNNPNIINSLIDKSVLDNPILILYKMGDILEYYITTRDTNKYFNFNEMMDKYYEYKSSHSIKEAEQNIIYNGFLTHSCNSFSLKRINKYGIGSSKAIDEDLNKKISRLEEILGISKFVSNQQNNDSYYVTSPGVNSFNYACLYSPERLFLGPLKQSRDNSLPIKVGESKTEYLKRVIDKKISNVSLENQTEAKLLGYEIVDLFFKESPGVVLIPTNQNLNVSRNSLNIDTSSTPFIKYFETRGREGLNEGYNFFSKQLGGINGNMGDLECLNSFIDRNNIGIFNCPDMFDLFQIIAKKRGMIKGSELDYFTGLPIREKNIINKESSTNIEIKDYSNLEFKNEEVIESGTKVK